MYLGQNAIKRAQATGIFIVLYQDAVLICVASCQVYSVTASAALEFAQILKAAKPPWQQDLISI